MQFTTAVGLTEHPLHIMGTSLGGAIAAMYTSTFPKNVVKLTLVCPASKLIFLFPAYIYYSADAIIFVLLFIPQGKPNYKVFNTEYFIEQLHVEKNYTI